MKGYWLSYHDGTPSFYFFLFQASSSFRPTLLLSFFTISFHVIFGLPFPLKPSSSRSHAFFTGSSSCFFPSQHVTHPSQTTSLYHFHNSFFQAQPFHELTCILLSDILTPHIFCVIAFSVLLQIPSFIFTFQVSEPYTIAVLNLKD